MMISIIERISKARLGFFDKYRIIQSPNVIYLGTVEIRDLFIWLQGEDKFFAFHKNKADKKNDITNSEVYGMEIIEVNQENYLQCGIK